MVWSPRDGKLPSICGTGHYGTLATAGIDYDFATWYGFLAPANTPAVVLQRLSPDI